VKLKFRSSIFASIAIGAGIIVFLGYFIKIPFLLDMRAVLLQWALILTAVALIVGISNLFRVHLRKIRSGEKGSVYSLVLILSLIFTLVISILFGPVGSWSLWIFNSILIPIESSLMAVLAIALVYAAARLFYKRTNLFTLIFAATVVFILISTFTLPGISIPGLNILRDFITRVLSVAGARGILLGVALGTIATGLRILMGADRPYGE
jgi:hypothetical protein